MRIHSLRRPPDDLTPRQREVMSLMAKGRTNPEIATELGMTIDGAKWHVREILSKFGVDSREEAVRVWRSRGHGTMRLAIVLGGGIAASAAAVVVGVALWVAASGGKGPEAGATGAAPATANVLHIATSSAPAFNIPIGPPITIGDSIAKLPASEGNPMAAYDGKLIVMSSVTHLNENANPSQPTFDETFRLWDPVTGKFTPIWTTMGSIASDYVTSVDGDWAAVVGTWGDDASAWRISLHNLRTGEVRQIAKQQAPGLDSGTTVGGIITGGQLIWNQTVLISPATAEQEIESYSIATGKVTTLFHSNPLQTSPDSLGHATSFGPGQDMDFLGAPMAGGGRVAWIGNDARRTINVLDLATGAVSNPVSTPDVIDCALSSDGRYLTWSDSAEIFVTDLTNGKQLSVALGDAPLWSGDILSWYAQNSTAGFYDHATNTVRLVDQPPDTGTNVGQVMGNWFVWQIFPSDRSTDGYWAIIPVK